MQNQQLMQPGSDCQFKPEYQTVIDSLFTNIRKSKPESRCSGSSGFVLDHSILLKKDAKSSMGESVNASTTDRGSLDWNRLRRQRA
jgi:hypothetical protein